jgi:hypothetical protein
VDTAIRTEGTADVRTLGSRRKVSSARATVRTAAGSLASQTSCTTADISDKVIPDVLIMVAGTEDWGVPLNQFHQQIAAPTNARSVTARLFTRAEQGHQHCQVGNLGLVLDFMLNWIDFHIALRTTRAI